MLELAVTNDRKLSAQWIRLSFHDAGTFNQNTREGGANGCLLNDERMQVQQENLFLTLPILILEKIKRDWLGNEITCIEVSGADMVQFAGHFGAIRQTGNPGLTNRKKEQLHKFKWGRPGEANCVPEWTDSLNYEPTEGISHSAV